MDKVKHKTGIRHPFPLRQRAQEFRREGKTHREIAKELGISLGSAHLWTADIAITKEQERAIQQRKSLIVYTPEKRQQLREAALKHLVPHLEKYTSEELIERIRKFHRENGRIPLKREFNMYREFSRRFGGWNQAIRIAGFSTNPELFAHKFTAKDGHRCDSFTEKIIDDWLSGKKISHERNWRYGSTKLTADFFIGQNTVIEFFGLARVQKKYDEIIERKRKLAKEFSWQLIELYPEDIFPKSDAPRKILGPCPLCASQWGLSNQVRFEVI